MPKTLVLFASFGLVMGTFAEAAPYKVKSWQRCTKVTVPEYGISETYTCLNEGSYEAPDCESAYNILNLFQDCCRKEVGSWSDNRGNTSCEEDKPAAKEEL